jgi:hypothetical protein
MLPVLIAYGVIQLLACGAMCAASTIGLRAILNRFFPA